jgi:hypothetical protein
MIQQGQVFKLTANGADGEPMWAYRYRLEGRSSARPQVGGFASRAEAQRALRKARHWRPAQIAAGIEPIRGLYELRHTYATFALRAGVPVFAVSRFIGSSIAMIDRHYGHLARDSREHAVALLDALALERAVDATWTSNRGRVNALSNSYSKPYRRRTHRRVDARWTPRLVLVAPTDNERS